MEGYGNGMVVMVGSEESLGSAFRREGRYGPEKLIHADMSPLGKHTQRSSRDFYLRSCKVEAGEDPLSFMKRYHDQPKSSQDDLFCRPVHLMVDLGSHIRSIKW